MSTQLHDMLRQVLDNGWDGIEKAGKMSMQSLAGDQQSLTERFEREAKIVKAAAETPEGRALLDLLVSTYLVTSPSADDYAVATADQFVITRARREGAQGVVFWILQRRFGVEAVPPSTEGGKP